MEENQGRLFLVTPRLTVRNFSLDDLEPLYRLLSDPVVMQYLEPPYDRDRTANFLQQAGLSHSPAVFAVDGEDRFVGYVIYHPYDQDSWEMGWVLCQEAWGKGYAQELTEALIADARGKTRWLVLECLPQQKATQAIALHNHFVLDGWQGDCQVYRLKLTK